MKKLLASVCLFFSIILLTSMALGFESEGEWVEGEDKDVPETECTENPDAPACQEPFYADDQAEYIYDLGASWLFAGSSTPGDSDPAPFVGWKAGGEFTDGISYEEDTETSGDTVDQYYIEDPGSSDSDDWGRGDFLRPQ